MFNLKLANKRNYVAINYESPISIDIGGGPVRKKNFLYAPQDYYDVIKQCRQNKRFILHEMKRENFISTKNLQNAIQKRIRKDTNEEKI